jgi:hypothetical protein
LSTSFLRVLSTINHLFCKSFASKGLRFLLQPVLIGFMLNSNQQLVDKLAVTVASINEVMAEMRGESPFKVAVNTREQVMAIVGQGLCLNGAHEIPAEMGVVRGMCRECYNAAKAAGFTEQTLVTLGLQTAEKSKGGRKRTLRESPLRQLIEGRPLVLPDDLTADMPPPGTDRGVMDPETKRKKSGS